MTITYLSGNRLQGLSTDVADTATFSDDFSGADNWVDQGASFAVNTTTDVLDFSVTRRDTNDGTTYDLTSTSDSAWVLRTKVNFTTVSNSSASGYYLFIGLSSASSSTDMNNGGVTQDFIGLQAIINNTAPKMGIGAYDSTGGFNNPMTTSFSTLMTVGTIWLEIIRVSTTLLRINIYSNSSYTTLIETISETILSTISNLKYIRVSNGVINSGGSGANTVTGTVDDIQFYNGVSSLTNKPTNVPNGSRYEETDTRKIYYSSNVHSFTTSGTFTPSTSGTMEYLVIAGGGSGGGYYFTGGGGAGGYRTASGQAVTAQAYAVTVGDGGIGNNSGRGTSGSNSSLIGTDVSITSTGGGAGGFLGSVGLSGGSGGGSHGYSTTAFGTGTSGQGFNGGGGFGGAPNYTSGGGGGSSAVGVTTTTENGGAGGAGTASSITGTSITRAGGGGGGADSRYGSVGAGGTGGGGAGVGNGATGGSGTANTGSGGGGTGNNIPSAGTGGNGGSGIVIIKYTGLNATGGTITTAWSERS